MKATITLNGSHWNIYREDGTTQIGSRNLKSVINICSQQKIDITNMSDLIDNLYSSENIFMLNL